MYTQVSKTLSAIFVNDTLNQIDIQRAELEELLLITPVNELIDLIRAQDHELIQINTANIPMFSNVDVLPKLIDIIKNASDVICYADIGAYLTAPETKTEAQRKYGETHYKLAVQLGLTIPATKNFALTSVGESYYAEKDLSKKSLMVKKLSLRIPVIQQSILMAEHNIVNLNNLLETYLSSSSVIRRLTSLKVLLGLISSISDNETQHTLNNIIWK